MWKKLILSAFFTFLCGCGSANVETVSNNIETLCNNDKETNRYEVFSAVINKVYAGSNQPIVIFEKTRKMESGFKLAFDEDGLKKIEKDFPNFDKSVADDFNAGIEQSYALEQKFQIPMPYRFVSEQDFAEINSDYMKRFDNFAKKFPEAVSPNSQRMIIFSRAGFNKKLSQAVVFVQIWNDRKSFFYLKRENCQWKVMRDETVSIH